MRPVFFFSYSSTDQTKVRAVCSELQNRGASVWLDQDQIRAGDEIASRINQGLSDAEHFVLFTSENWMKSKWTMQEFDAAFYLATNSGSRKVFVVRLDQTPLSPLLASRRAIEFRDALQVARELITAVGGEAPSNSAGSWTPIPWSSINDLYLTTLGAKVLAGASLKQLILDLGDRTLRMDLLEAVASDRIIIEDLRAELELYATQKDMILRYRTTLIEGGLGIFGPGFEKTLERRIADLEKTKDRMRVILQSLSPRLFAQENLADSRSA